MASDQAEKVVLDPAGDDRPTIRTAAFDDRVSRMTARARAALAVVAHFDLAGVPARIADSEDGARFFVAIEPAMAALTDLAAVPLGPYDLAWTDTTIRSAAAATWALTGLLNAERIVWSRVRAEFPSLRWNWGADGLPMNHRLSLAALDFTNDQQWLYRLRAEQGLPSTATAKFRTQRLRARRKAGYKMFSVAVHAGEVAELRRLGLLKVKGEPSADDVSEALQAFLAAGFAATSHEMDRDETGALPGVLAKRRDESLILWPVLGWLDRMKRFVQSLG